MQIHKSDRLPRFKEHVARIDSIFFEASARQEFSDQAERDAFRARWLGRYLEQHPDCFFVAIGDDGRPAGYLAGCLQNPTTLRHFDDIAYFQTIANFCRKYPAHFHVNVAAELRGRGIGAALVGRFVEWARIKSVEGIHVVTAINSRSVPFYVKCGFVPLQTFLWNLGISVCLGREL